MRTGVLALVLALVCTTASVAQTGVATSYTLRTYTAGATSTTNLLVVPIAQVQCNQPVIAGVPENPTAWRWNDPGVSGRDCVYVDTRLAALPDGNYEGTVQAVNADGSSSESARAPFVRRRPNWPAVPTGLRFSQ